MLRIGILGCGYIAERYATLICDGIEGLSLIGVCDTDAEKSRRFAKKYNTEALTPDDLTKDRIDIVCICTPNNLHSEHAIRYLSSGKDVIIEHPLATTLDEARKVIEAATKNGAKAFLVRQRRYLKSIQMLRKAINSKIITPKSAEAILFWNRREDYYKEVPWRNSKENGGVIINQASHFIDLVDYLLGSNIKDIKGTIGNAKHNIVVEDTAAGIITYQNGVTVNLLMSTAAPEGVNYANLTINCVDRVISLSGKQWEELEGFSSEELEFLTFDPEEEQILGGNHKSFLERVVGCINGKDTEVSEAIDGIKTSELIDAMYDNFQFDSKKVMNIIKTL